jgi:hypothetical protein
MLRPMSAQSSAFASGTVIPDCSLGFAVLLALSGMGFAVLAGFPSPPVMPTAAARFLLSGRFVARRAAPWRDRGAQFNATQLSFFCFRLVSLRKLPTVDCRLKSPTHSCNTTLNSDVFTCNPPLYLINPIFLNLFMKKFTRERVVPIISASISCDTGGTTPCG